MSDRPPTGIFDLPLELRQQIYRECMPHGRTMNLNNAAKNVEGLRKIHPVIAAEFREEQSRVCSQMHFLVSPTEWTVPPIIAGSVHCAVEVEFDLYTLYNLPSYCPVDYRTNDQLSVMSNNLRSFARWLSRSNISVDYLHIRFRGDEESRLQWCEPHTCEDGTQLGFSLATRATEMNREPVSIMEVLLDGLASFPIVEDAFVCHLDHILGWRSLEEDGSQTLYDCDYMMALCETWEGYLTGNRDVPIYQQIAEKLREERPNVERLLPLHWALDMNPTKS